MKYNLLVFDEIDSTNSEAIRMAKNCPSENYLILANNQTKSRGRNNKTWHSNPGNLHSSILLKHNLNLSYLPQISFVTAIAVYKTICSLIGSTSSFIKFKWPNDILINDKKVSGILLEAININNYHYLIIGIGINLKQSPINIKQLTTNLADENIEAKDSKEMLNILMVNFEKSFNQWQEKGFGKIREFWLKRAYKLGENITVNDGSKRITGIFKDIDQVGAIRLQLDDGKIMSLFSAEVIDKSCDNSIAD
jgi:BirA family biotin operon repressor/biotin-[acetyl-CoA-carboxylase] ligase